MTMSVKMLMDIALHAQEMAEAATAMAGAMRTVADDCAAQLAAKRAESTCADRVAANAPNSEIAVNAQNGTQERAQAMDEEVIAQTPRDAQNGVQEPVARFGKNSTINAIEQATSERVSHPASQPAGQTVQPAESTPHPTDQVSQPTDQASQPAKKLTIAEVRKYVSDRTRPDNRAQIKAIINSFGVAKLTELPEDQYEPLMEKVSAL